MSRLEKVSLVIMNDVVGKRDRNYGIYTDKAALIGKRGSSIRADDNFHK
jgi:hypothetical protein